MKKGFVLGMLMLLSLSTFAQQAQHVVLITIDGLRPTFYTDTFFQAPHLHEIAENGVYARRVNSVFPSMTYPAHTAIVTGVWPVKHGIYFNNMFNPNGPSNAPYWNDSSIKVPTIWRQAQQKGLKVAALLWPVSADAPVMYNIPDIGSLGDSVREAYSKPAGFIADLKKNVFNNADHIEYGYDHNVAKIASYVIKKDQPNLMTIHFFSVDHYQHEEGLHGDKVMAAVADADSSVGMIIDALKEAGIWEKTVLIVTGDHGFQDVNTTVNPNVWLAKAGLITDVKKDDWKAQFYAVGGSCYLYLKDKKDTKTLQQVKDILTGLSPEEQALFRIIDRKQIKKVGGNPEVALALSGEKGASFGNAVKGEAVKPGHGGAHGYYPDSWQIRTGFLACGPGIEKGGEIEEMNLRDITPVLAKILRISMPGVDGKIPAGLMTK